MLVLQLQCRGGKETIQREKKEEDKAVEGRKKREDKMKGGKRPKRGQDMSDAEAAG